MTLGIDACKIFWQYTVKHKTQCREPTDTWQERCENKWEKRQPRETLKNAISETTSAAIHIKQPKSGGGSVRAAWRTHIHIQSRNADGQCNQLL